MAAVNAGCTSLWEQRDHQQVVWSDGDAARIEVWLRQGTVDLGPIGWLGDVLATPVLWVAETTFAVAAGNDDDSRIRWGPFGYALSLLPFVTCVPLDAKPSVWLHLHDELRLPAADRAQLAALGEREAVEWLAAHYAAAFPDGGEIAAAKVREWVSAVRLVAPGAAAGAAPRGVQ